MEAVKVSSPDCGRLVGLIEEEVDYCWPVIEPLLQKAVDEGPKDFSTQDIYNFIKKEAMQCWIVHRKDQILLTVVTQILVYPQRKVLGVLYLGARPHTLKYWVEHMGTLKAYAKEHGCAAVRVVGRHGWAKVYKPKFHLSMFELEIDV